MKSFASGAVAGAATAAAAFCLWNKDAPKSGPVLEQNATDEGVSPSPAPDAKEQRHIIPFGTHGPVSDILARKAYVSSYNRMTRNPHWVAEHLTQDSLNNEDPDSDGSNLPSRSHSSFKADKDIPISFQSKLSDYKGSRYDRGHLAPCADVKSSQEAIDETFLLTNISPQVGVGFNRGYWLQMESFVRNLTKQFDNVYVVSGPLYLPKLDANGKSFVTYQVLGDPPNTAVPTHFFKVILVDKGGNSAIGGFVVPNEAIETSEPLVGFITPIDAIEASSGLQFFPRFKRQQATALCKTTNCVVPAFKTKVKKVSETN